MNEKPTTVGEMARMGGQAAQRGRAKEVGQAGRAAWEAGRRNCEESSGGEIGGQDGVKALLSNSKKQIQKSGFQSME